jgi:High potential iron-sulfur protein
MNTVDRLSRRHLLQKLTMGAPLLPLVAAGLRNAALAADAPLLNPQDKDAKAVKYVEDASQAQGALAGSTCANCAVYQGKSGAATGPCQIFPGKLVKAAGWCSSWAPQM